MKTSTPSTRQRNDTRWFYTLSILFIAASLFTATTGQALAQQGHAASLYAKCAAACHACSTECDACNKHCLGMVAAGDKAHLKSAKISADCKVICDAAAKICEQKGPLSTDICEACIKACDTCAAECAKSPRMAPMAACKKACDQCVAACKLMIAG